jgi:hypothetical protein
MNINFKINKWRFLTFAVLSFSFIFPCLADNFSRPPDKVLSTADITNLLTLKYFPNQKFYREYTQIWIGGDPRIAGGPGIDILIFMEDKNGTKSDFKFNENFKNFKIANLSSAQEIVNFYCYIYNCQPVTESEAKASGIELLNNNAIQFITTSDGFAVTAFLKEKRDSRYGYFCVNFIFTDSGCKIIDEKCIKPFVTYD